jgi:uncharacterized phage protein (TIGR02220 family)
MAENKKSFVLYADLLHTVMQLPNDKAGLLFKHILSYVNDLEPVTEDIIVKIAFEPIKQQLKRDLKKYEKKKKQWSEAGKKSAEVRKNKRQQTLTNVKNVATDLTVNVNDNVNVNVSNIIDWSKLLDKFNSITGKKSRVVPEKAKKAILSRLKEGYTKQDILNAIQNCYNDSHHKETNHKYLTLEFISRPDKLEKFATIIKSVNKPAPKYEGDWR